MARRGASAGAGWALVALCLLSAGLADGASGASNGRLAAEFWSEEVCGGNVCYADPRDAPRFSPDGRFLAVRVPDDGVAIGRPDGAGFRFGYKGGEAVDVPSWSPRSDALVFADSEP